MPVDIVNYAKSQQAGGKFVVLRNTADADSGLLLFSDFNTDFQHADIVRRWTRLTGMTPDQAGLRIAGGGWWRVDETLLVLYGQSAAYGRFDAGWLRGRVEPGSVFHEARIDVQ